MSQNRYKLDETDRKILVILQQEGRITNVELAEKIGISAPPCLRRVKALEDAGYIAGYQARLAPDLMGYPLVVFATVSLSSHTELDVAAFHAKVESWPEIRDCWMLAGDIDYLLRITARDWNHYQDFLTNSLMAVPNVHQVKTLPSVRAVKAAPNVPVDQ